MKYYIKYVLSNPVYVAGNKVPFEPVGDDRGVIALDEDNKDHAAVLNALKMAAAAGILGIREIDKATYEDLKKKESSQKSEESLTLLRERLEQDPLKLQPQPPVIARAPEPLSRAARPAAEGQAEANAEKLAASKQQAEAQANGDKEFVPAVKKVKVQEPR